MLGKNRGKTRNVKPIKTATSCNLEDSDSKQDGATGLLIKMRYSMIPNKVGSEFSFTQFAAAVEPSMLHDILKCRLTPSATYSHPQCVSFLSLANPSFIQCEEGHVPPGELYTLPQKDES